MVKTVGKVSIQPSGQWVKANTYKKLQLVSNLGSSYLAIQPVPANTEIDNTSYWMMIASKGDKGNTGKSIQTITKTGTVGLVDTYTILYSDLTTSTFTVNNGNGVTGIVVEKTGTAGNVDTYTMTITMASGEPYVSTFTITNGEDGDVQASAIAEPYDNTIPYKVGNLLSASGKMYLTIKDAPAGTPVTNTEYFEEKSVADIIEMIKQGAIVTGHSQVADNLTPYSEDSGTTQENPFISQGTGTDNNSVIVTTGNIARQLEKQGNTIVKNQLLNGSYTNHGLTIIGQHFKILKGTMPSSANDDITVLANPIPAGHKVLTFIANKKGGSFSGTAAIGLYHQNSSWASYFDFTTNTAKIETLLTSGDAIHLFLYGGYDITEDVEFDIYYVDLTQMFNGNDNIPADLLANPSHFSWYYNGSMSYDAGSLQNCNGRYLECGQGRNLFNKNAVASNKLIIAGGTEISSTGNSHSDYFIATPNIVYYVKNITGNVSYNLFACYNNNKSFLGFSSAESGNSHLYKPLPNTRYVIVNMKNADVDTQSIELYYTPEQGGEGYDQYYPFVAPIRIDTGNETLKAFDKKLPSGVIEHNTGEVDLGTLNWTYDSTYPNFYTNTPFTSAKVHGYLVCPKYRGVRTEYVGMSNLDISITEASGARIRIKDSNYTNADTFKESLNGVMLQYELATPTTEQGTPYSDYADICDYSYMAWFDTDGNLVSIPQGCKLFYPVDYKGFTDDLVMYTEGDATALAKNEDITDVALNARGYYKLQDLLTAFGANGMVGGTLRQTLCAKESLEFDNTGCVDIGACSWTYYGAGSTSAYDMYISNALDGVAKSTAKNICTKYRSKVVGESATANCVFIGSGSGSFNVYVTKGTYANATEFTNAHKGVLLAYEKA